MQQRRGVKNSREHQTEARGEEKLQISNPKISRKRDGI